MEGAASSRFWNSSSAIVVYSRSSVLVFLHLRVDTCPVPTPLATVRPVGCTWSGRNQNTKTQICQRTCQPTKASPLGHFRYSWCLQRLRWANRFFEKHFAWTVWKEQVAILLWIASPSHARPQAQAFQLHNWHSRLLGGSPVESLQSHCIHTMSHWSRLLPVMRDLGSTPPGGTYVKPGFPVSVGSLHSMYYLHHALFLFIYSFACLIKFATRTFSSMLFVREHILFIGTKF